MNKRFKYFFLPVIICWQHVGAQIQPALPTLQPPAPAIISDTVPKWLRKINLLPHEFVEFKPGKQVDYILYGPILRLSAALPKSLLIEKGDSIFKASKAFGKRIAKMLRLKKSATPLTVSTLYFDRACANAGISRRMNYLIKGRKCKMQSDSSFDDSSILDSEISSRLHLFRLLPNQFFAYNSAAKALVLDNITSKCYKDFYYKNDPENTPAIKVNSRVLFEVVQRSFPKFIAVGCGCMAPYGEYQVDITVSNLNHENLRNKYDSLYHAYRAGMWP